MESFCHGKSSVSFENYKIAEHKEAWNSQNLLLYKFAMAIKNSFHNGHAREYLEALFYYMRVSNRYFYQAQRQTVIDFLFLKVEQKKYFKSKAPVPTKVCPTTTSESDSPDTSMFRRNETSSSSELSKEHHSKDVRRPDFVVFKNVAEGCLHGNCVVVFEVKSKFANSSIREGIAELLSYGLSKRSQQRNSKDVKEIALILMTPCVWIVGILPHFEEELKKPLVFTTMNVFGTTAQGDTGFLIGGYVSFLTFLSHFIY